MMPFDSYFQSIPKKATPEIVVLPDQVEKKSPTVKKRVRKIGRFQPFNDDVLNKAKCDIVRILIWQSLKLGDFYFDALHHLINLWIKEQDIPAFEVSKQSLGRILSANSGWNYKGGVVSKRKSGWSSLEKTEDTLMLKIIMLILDQMIREKKTERVGTNHFKYVMG